MSAIVLDGHLTKSALSCVRSLGSKGIAISCGSVRATAAACHSRFVSRRFIYASPKTHPEQFIADVIKEAAALHASTGTKPVIFSFSDATALLISRSRARIEGFALLALPSFESVEVASDKGDTYELARQLSIPVIRTYEANFLDAVAYPAIVKHRHSIVWKEGGSVSGSAAFVFSKEELLSVYAQVKEDAGEAPLIQEFIRGGEYGVEMVCMQGESVATFVHKRIRSLSPRGGAAVVKETAPETEEVSLMREYAHALAKELAWHGPIMVEFKIDSRDGRVLLMEINGRFWGSLPLAVRAGVDFPAIAYDLARGSSPKEAIPSTKYIRTRHFLGDCRWLWSVLFSRDPLRKLLYPPRLKALWDFKTEIFKSKGDVFDLRDLAPSLFEYTDIIAKWRSKA